MNTKCILITGPAHSATRLLVDMLSRHPDVNAAEDVLNYVSEFIPLHQFFIRSIDNTPVTASEYKIDKNELFFILDAFLKNIDPGKSYAVVKLPFYPLLCMPYFFEYFGENLIPVYTERPTEKIVESFFSRGEDKLYFQKRPQAVFRQIKKLPLKKRKEHVGKLNPSLFFKELTEYTGSLREKWDIENPSKSFYVIDVEQLTKSRDEYERFLVEAGLSLINIQESFEVIDEKRLLHNKPAEFKEYLKRKLKSSIRSMTS